MADEDEQGEGFLSRWSRRKREVEQATPETTETELEHAQDSSEAAEAEVFDEELEANRLAAEAIDIDALGKDDDFTVFLKRGVPELLRKTALRKLWRTDPVFANVDGLNDYDEDFRNPTHSVYKSLWQVGRGFLTQGEQQAQHDSGRLSQPIEVEAAELDEDEAVTSETDQLAEDELGALPSDEPEALPVAALERDGGAAEDALSPKGRNDTDASESAPPQKRISIRSRLAG
jgi:hypothetical protein